MIGEDGPGAIQGWCWMGFFGFYALEPSGSTKKGGLRVGKTKRGKGTKVMAVMSKRPTIDVCT